MIDTHVHLSHAQYNGEFPFLTCENNQFPVRRGTREELIDLLRDAGIGACVEPSITLESIDGLLALSDRYPDFLFPAVGVHPKKTCRYRTEDENGRPQERKLRFKDRKRLEMLANDRRAVAIGETGLDFHMPFGDRHRLRQRFWFIYQILLADKRKLPLILHVRDADRPALRILKRMRKRLHGGVYHCFRGDAETAKAYAELGFCIGIGASLLSADPFGKKLEDAVAALPLDRILLETDAPYVKPDCPEMTKKAFGKTRNTPLILPAVASRIAEIKGISVEETVRAADENAIRVFRLPKRRTHL